MGRWTNCCFAAEVGPDRHEKEIHMFDSKNISHEFDLSASSGIELMSRTQYFAAQQEEEKAIDTFGTLGSAGTLGGCFGCLGTAGCCC